MEQIFFYLNSCITASNKVLGGKHEESDFKEHKK